MTEKVTDKEYRILDLLMINPKYTSIELANKISESRKTVSEIIKSLKEKGIIVRVGSDRKGYWKINI